MSLESQTPDSQFSPEIDWIPYADLSTPHSDMYDFDSQLEAIPKNNDDLSAILGLDTCNSLPTVETLQESIANPCSEIQFTAEKTQTHLLGATQPTTGAPPPPTADAKDFTPSFVPCTPDLVNQKATELNTEGGDDQANAEDKSTQELADRLRILRCELQNGFLPAAGQPRRKKMKTLSAYLKELEHIEDLPGSVLSTTRIYKVLKKITRLDDIPKNSKFSFKERAVMLVGKWKPSVEQEDPTIYSTGQPIKPDDTECNDVADGKNTTNTLDSHKLPGNEAPTSATRLMEERVLDKGVTSEQQPGDHNDESARVPDNEHSQPALPPSPAIQDLITSKSGKAVVDSTDDDEVDVASGLRRPGQPTEDQNRQESAVKSTQAPRSLLPSSTNSGLASAPARKDHAGPNSDPAESGTKKRKRSNTTQDRKTSVSASGSSQERYNTPKRQRPRRKTSPGQHLSDEVLWMNGSVSRIEKMIKDMKEEIDVIELKRVLLHDEHERTLEENETEMRSAQRRLKESIGLKEYLLAWGAQDEKVTKEWSCSE
ncbi:uncharacterized protein RSE6_15140 [Rhynchosporium secalis]|uniref:TFIIS N-terminal domain-containing protein n=1 Tax=Rhynchosporium secalis TaxID=38038 RepID=A0A1E1MWR6_RHYSE|nr:uncharacterized protein RSE6_15140 [Rhynchosporium secalis]